MTVTIEEIDAQAARVTKASAFEREAFMAYWKWPATDLSGRRTARLAYEEAKAAMYREAAALFTLTRDRRRERVG